MRWVRPTLKGDKPLDAPLDVARALIGKRGIRLFPTLIGTVEAPTLRQDGSVLDRPGYDPASGILFDPGGVDFPAIPSHPTKADAERALAEWLELFAEFPFVDEADRAVAVSYNLGRASERDGVLT